MKETLEIIRKTKVDCLYGKKKHFNAADRKQSYHYWLGVPLVLINIAVGTTLFISLTEGREDWTQFIPVVLAFIAAIMGGMQTYFNFSEKVEGHKRCGNEYLGLMKRCNMLESLIRDELVNNADAIKRLELISDDVNSINKMSESYSTSNSDYQKAKLGIESGEETYNQDELKL